MAVSRGLSTQVIEHDSATARVPAKVQLGVFATALMVLQTNHEVTLDFLSTIVQPQQIAARVIMSAASMGQFLATLRTNLESYQREFGLLTAHSPVVPRSTLSGGTCVSGGADCPAAPTTPGDAQAASAKLNNDKSGTPNLAGVYSQLKLPEGVIPGVFANSVRVVHMAEEFCFDFVFDSYPRAMVVCRILMAAGRIPSVLTTLHGAIRGIRDGDQSPPVSLPPG